MNSSRRTFALAALALPLIGCNQPSLPPKLVEHRQGRKPVDSAREFLEQRHKAVMSVLDGFVRYRQAVIDRDKAINNREIAWAYEVMELEQTDPTPKTLRAFIDSPEGAYLSAQDKEFLDRLDRKYQRQIQDRYMALASDDGSRGIPLSWGHSELILIYGRLEAIRRFIMGMDQAAVAAVVKAVVDRLAAADRQTLVAALREPSAFDARKFYTDEQRGRWTAAVSHIQPALAAHRADFRARAEVERRLIELIINQSLFFSPFLYANAAVGVTRFNDYAEAEQTRLDRMVKDELRRL